MLSRERRGRGRAVGATHDAASAVAGFQEARMAREVVIQRRQDYAYEDEQGEQRGARLLREMLEVAILTLLLFIVVHLIVQNYRVDGPSMQPTLHNHEYILVDKASYAFGKPQRGDVVVFEFPRDTSQDFVKRIIGVPGERARAVVREGHRLAGGGPTADHRTHQAHRPLAAVLERREPRRQPDDELLHPADDAALQPRVDADAPPLPVRQCRPS